MSLCIDDLLPECYLHRVTCTRCRIDTINSPDDGHIAALNMYRIEINIQEKELCIKLVIYKKTRLIYYVQFYAICHNNILHEV